MREISSFTHSPSLPYCKFVRIHFLFFVSHFTLQLYTTINIRIDASFSFRVCVCLCNVYKYIYISFFCRLIQTILPKFSAFSLLLASELYLLCCGFFFFSFACLSKWKYREKLLYTMSFFQSLSLSLSFSFFSLFFCSLFFFFRLF